MLAPFISNTFEYLSTADADDDDDADDGQQVRKRKERGPEGRDE